MEKIIQKKDEEIISMKAEIETLNVNLNSIKQELEQCESEKK